MFLWGMSTDSWAGLVRMLAMSWAKSTGHAVCRSASEIPRLVKIVSRDKTIPDLILTNSQNEIRAVGEGKTFWTKDLAAVQRLLLASWLGKPYSNLPSMNRFAQVTRSASKIHG
jgi:hypothetical protein